jgi:hypothetical protein
MHTHDTLERRNRYAPSPTGKRISLKNRDRAWLELIARHGPLPSHYLHAATENIHPNLKVSLTRLTDLVSETNTPHGGAYLRRPHMQCAIENARNRPLIYDLSEYGWAAMEKSRSDVVRASGPFRHQVMVACVTASIEIACISRKDVDYIPAERFLPSTNRLGFDLKITNPSTDKAERHRVVPDQLFALAYQTDQGTRYRAFAVECDRATEPVISPKLARKSYLRSYLQYRELVGSRSYKKQYGLNCPLLVLNVMISQTRQWRFMDLVQQHAPQGNAYMLFKTETDFEAAFVPPKTLAGLLTDPWERVGKQPETLLRK